MPSLKPFLFFFSEDYQEYWFAICDNSENKPIIAIGFDDPELIIRYTSLTNMILTIAEAYESNIFVLKTFDNGFSTIKCINESLFREIK